MITVRYGTNTYPTLTKQNIYGRTVELRTFRESNLAFIPTASTTGGDKTTWNYEATTGLLLSKRDNADKGVTYTYTPDGKLLTRTWERGLVTTYAYTHAGQLKTTDYSDSTPDVTISYDRLGRQLTQSNGLAISDFTYDPATLALDKETITYTLPNQPAFTRILDRSQDSLARPTGYTLGTPTSPSASEAQATYGYNPTTGRLETVSNGTSSFRYDYLANSSLIEHVVATAGAVHDVHLTYEPTRNVLASRQNKVGTDVISQYDYSVNSIGQRSNVSQRGSAFAATRAIAWGYDSLGQVIQADSNENTHDRAYQYDTIGNREKSANGLLGDLPTNQNWAANPLNQLTKVNGENLPTDSYDSDGNQLNAKILPLGSSSLASCVYSWDAENRLIEVKNATGAKLATYTYDSQSRRIATTAGGETSVYVYDGWICIAEYNSPNLQSPISHVHSNLWGLDLSGTMQGAGGVGGLLSVSLITNNSITNNYFPTFDGNGNVSEYLTSTGTVAAHFEYDPFGNTVVNTDTTNQFAYRFSTKPQDLTTGLLYYGYRFYDPLTGRWPSRDPIEEKGGVNLYEFVLNSPTNALDAFGLFSAGIVGSIELGYNLCSGVMDVTGWVWAGWGSEGWGGIWWGVYGYASGELYHKNIGRPDFLPECGKCKKCCSEEHGRFDWGFGGIGIMEGMKNRLTKFLGALGMDCGLLIEPDKGGCGVTIEGICLFDLISKIPAGKAAAIGLGLLGFDAKAGIQVNATFKFCVAEEGGLNIGGIPITLGDARVAGGGFVEVGRDLKGNLPKDRAF